jgi:hypothetical protein
MTTADPQPLRGGWRGVVRRATLNFGLFAISGIAASLLAQLVVRLPPRNN